MKRDFWFFGWCSLSTCFLTSSTLAFFSALLCLLSIFFNSLADRFSVNIQMNENSESGSQFPHILTQCILLVYLAFPGDSEGKESACSAGDPGSIPGLGRSGEGRGYPLQYSGLENSMGCVVHGVTKSQTRLSNLLFIIPKGAVSVWYFINN